MTGLSAALFDVLGAAPLGRAPGPRGQTPVARSVVVISLKSGATASLEPRHSRPNVHAQRPTVTVSASRRMVRGTKGEPGWLTGRPSNGAAGYALDLGRTNRRLTGRVPAGCVRVPALAASRDRPPPAPLRSLPERTRANTSVPQAEIEGRYDDGGAHKLARPCVGAFA